MNSSGDPTDHDRSDGQDFTILIPSNRPELAKTVEASLVPLKVVHLDGTGYPSFAKLINDCIVRSPTEIVAICSDKVAPSPDHIRKMLSLLQSGYAFVGLYYFACFAFAKQLIRQIGFFDERFVSGECEDSDFIVRLREADLAYYLTKEVPYTSMASSWNNTEARTHFVRKWGSINLYETARLLPEEEYPYDLGPAKPREFLPRSSSLEQ